MNKNYKCKNCCPSCEEIAKAGGYPRWGCLMRCLANGMGPGWLRRELIRVAKKFVPDATFRGTSSHAIADASYGGYIWSFVIKMRQEQIWNYPEFRAGFFVGRYVPMPERGSNPYLEPARQSSWDKGYIWGLYERETRKKGAHP